MSNDLLVGWRIEGQFDADTTVSIIDGNDFEICEIGPFDGDWTKEEIARVELLKSAPDLASQLQEARAQLDAALKVKEQLLAALRRAESQIEKIQGMTKTHGDCPQWGWPDFSYQMEKIRSVAAQAKDRIFDCPKCDGNKTDSRGGACWACGTTGSMLAAIAAGENKP